MILITNIKNLFYHERKISRYKFRLALVFIHSLFLLAITVALQYTSLVRYDEVSFLKWAYTWKHTIFGIEAKPFNKDVVFIDVSKDLALANDDAYGPPDSTLRGAQHVITDRAKLAKLFELLNRHPNEYKYIVCDVLFEKPGPGDELLKPQIEKLQRLIASAVWDKDKLARPIYKIPYGIVNYTAINKTTFTKLPIYYNDSLKSLPVMLYERTTQNCFRRNGFMIYLENKPTFNTIIPNFYYKNSDLIDTYGNKPINTYYLGELLADPECFTVLKDKFIIIGDIKNDVHITYSGGVPGMLILWNSYLTLFATKTQVSFQWLGVLFIFYALLSYWIIIHPDRKLKEIHEKINTSVAGNFIIKYISFIGFLILINIISYFFFGLFVSLFYIASYLTFLQMLIDKLPQWQTNIYTAYQKHFRRSP